jgi:hypothetical protein
MLNYPSQTANETPTGEGSRSLGKGATEVKPRYKDGEGAKASTSESKEKTPKGMSAKGSKDEGKDAKTSHEGGKEGARATKSEAPADAPSGVNDMTIPHVHLPEMLHQKDGDEVHLHVYGRLKAHNMEKGKNHAVVEVKSVKQHGESDNATPRPNAAAMPMDALKQAIKGPSKDTYSEK